MTWASRGRHRARNGVMFDYSYLAADVELKLRKARFADAIASNFCGG